MYEVWKITDLPIDPCLTIAVTELASNLDTNDLDALERILEDWVERIKTEYIETKTLNNPLDVIEAKLERISALCDQAIEKLELSSL